MSTAETLVTGAMVLVFAAIHLFTKRLRFLDSTPRSKWLSFAGGVAVSYVFLHVLPEIGAHQRTFAAEMGVPALVAESTVYSLALAGLAVFYGLERAVKVSRARSRAKGAGDRLERRVLYLHLATYGAFNMLVGYLLVHREEGGAGALALYFVALALHFVTADFGMRNDHSAAYDRIGRWVIAAAVIAGWGLGLATQLSGVLIGCLFALLAGSIVLTVLKEELPEERESYFRPFALGLVIYAGLVLAERHLV
ncbi:hypothetical protein [Aurantiacibacter spongiae]|uniref:ZIP family metal transporter n=1 Tax=Aurantiacibacter spongiae TaxID=2488860 RepID=A0A3N5CWZ3_9SPHN|nr:hypothetical protein [Aurantiacibacter spongiae]RPF72090.1 hypothetical protein EG799_11025 [Aurantiacibacter spongiae]